MGFYSNIDNALSADNFEVETDFLIQSIIWYGMYDSDNSDNSNVEDSFDIRIYTLSGGELFVALGINSVTKTDFGVDDAYGENIYLYEVSLSDFGVEFSSGTYLISISNSNSLFYDWRWADGTGGDGITYYLDSGSWVAESYDVDLAFSLNGEIVQTSPVPEPGSILLFGLGLLVTALYKRPGRHR